MDIEYCYKPLPSEASFRVLELLPGDEDDDISYILHFADWNHPPSYEALSYTWGDTGVKVPTLCDGKRLEVMPNLRDGLRKLRCKTHSRTIWADAVCINQRDMDERSEQVNKMLSIYRGARRVLVWLGPDENGYAAMAVHAMEEIMRASSRKGESLATTKRAPAWTELACNSASTWNSIKWFFSRPWFSRLWVLQEVNSGPEVLVICAKFEIRWQVVKSIAEYIESSDIYEVYGFWESELWSALTIMGDYTRCKTDDTGRMDVLHSLRRFHTTDPRDKIYAVLGMEAFQVEEFRLEEKDTYPISKKPWISADYTKSTVEVYRDLAATLILKEPRNLNPLSYVQSGRGHSHEDFPSWVPRWDQTNNVHTTSRCMDSPTTDASRGVPVFVQISESNKNILEVAGLHFDTVATHTKVENELWFHSEIHRMEDHPVLEFWRRQQANPTLYPTGDLSIFAYAVALTAGTHDQHISIEDYIKSFEAYLVRLQEVEMQKLDDSNSSCPKEMKTGNWRKWERAARDTCWNRTIFTTHKGYIGVGPKFLLVGDLVCVLSGGRVPFILRRKGDIFQLIGECYVYGIMSGQAVELIERSRKETVFHIN
jgi:hypothetical protein